jgi:hypothetical protein
MVGFAGGEVEVSSCCLDGFGWECAEETVHDVLRVYAYYIWCG